MFTFLSYCEINTHSVENIFLQLKCHFTWNVRGEESSLDDLEDRGYNQVEFLNTEFKAVTYNLFAYIKHCRGQYQVALEYLEQAEEFIMHRQDHQGKIGHLVTWGSYAWVCYHLGRLLEAHTYICAHVHGKSLQSCLTLCDPMDCSTPGSSVQGFLQARILETLTSTGWEIFARSVQIPIELNALRLTVKREGHF